MGTRHRIGAALALAAAVGTAERAWAQGPRPPGEEREGPRPPQPPSLGEPHGPFGGAGGPHGPRPEGASPGGPHSRPMHPLPPLSDEQMDQALRWLKENEPDHAEKIASLREPEMFNRVVREAFERMTHLKRLKEHDPAEYERVMGIQKMERAAGGLAEKIRKTETEDERRKLTEQLKDRLATLFDMRETGREREVKELERRLAELRKILSERKDRKGDIVERRMAQMLGQGEVLEW